MIHSVLVACLVSCLINALLLAGQRQLFARIRRYDLHARQACHTAPTLRLGGVGIVAGLLAVAILDPRAERMLIPLLIAALPVFLSGFLEDIGRHQSPAQRLLAAALSGVVALWLLDVSIPRLGIPFLDPALAFLPLAIAFTLFATTGLVHAFNLIDGLNGFAGFNALICIAALLGLAQLTETPGLLLPGFALAGAIVGFLVLNYPAGRLFLGDTGAYLVGFCLAWMTVHLAATEPRVTPWALLLVFFWPVADTVLAIVRRRRRGMQAAQADRLHMHHIMMRGIEIAAFGRRDRRRSNPLASALLVPLLLPPPLTALLLWDRPLPAALATGLYAGLFALTYGRAIDLLPRIRSRTRTADSPRRARPLRPENPPWIAEDAR